MFVAIRHANNDFHNLKFPASDVMLSCLSVGIPHPSTFDA